MSGKRRKNAGEGYGYMFHGAFSKKADAVAKERKTKGAWVKGTPTNQGYRYLVMSPRTNPAKRKKKAKKETKGEMMKRRLAELSAYSPRPTVAPAQNPSELLVMGANPSSAKNQEIKIPIPGGEVVIRTNPEPRRNLNFGFGPTKNTKKELAQSKREFKTRVRELIKENRAEHKRLRAAARGSFKDKKKLESLFHEVYGSNPAPVCGAMIGGYRCSRKPGHRGPHLPQGATMRTRHRLRKGWQPNPSAEALREDFTGREVERVQVMHEPHMPAGDYAMLGKLLSLYVKPKTGGQVLEIKAAGGTVVVADESARQIYFVGGDQDISSGLSTFGAVNRGADLFELGQARRIDYKQRKEHVAHPEQDSWRHEFGEETGERPMVLYDARNKRIVLEGGAYEIRTEGIVN